MNKTILFPTDFSVGSLNIVRSVLHKMDADTKCRIILVHGYRPSSSITDLLFTSPTSWVRSLTNSEFEDACEVIRNKYESRISEVIKDVFYGNTQAAFNDYLKANDVSEIHVPQVHDLQMVSKRSFDVMPFIRNSGLVVNEVMWEESARAADKGMVAEVFTEQVAYRQA